MLGSGLCCRVAGSRALRYALTTYLGCPSPEMPKLYLENLAGTASDGAAVMLGKETGVIVRLEPYHHTLRCSPIGVGAQ